MISSILTSDGQTTLPEPVWVVLDLESGNRIEHVLTENYVDLRRASADLTALDELLDRSKLPVLSTT